MQKIKIILRSDLNEEEKDCIRNRIQSFNISLSETIKNGFDIYYYSLSGVKSYWSKYAKEFIEIK